MISTCACVHAQPLQSCLALCDPIGVQPTRLLCPWEFCRQAYWSGLPCPPPGDLSDPRSNVGLLHFLHWQVGSLSQEPPGKPSEHMSMSVLSPFSRVQLFVTLWTVACQASLSLRFSRQEQWSGFPCPPTNNYFKCKWSKCSYQKIKSD